MKTKLFTRRTLTTPFLFAVILTALLVAPVFAATTIPIFATKWGSAGTSDGQFTLPAGIEATASKVYVADTSNNRIQIFTRAGILESKIGPSFDKGGGVMDSLYHPGGVTVDAAGNIYVADTGNNRLIKFDASLTFVTMIGSTGPEYDKGIGLVQLSSPGGLAVDPTGGFLYVADTGNDRILKLNTADLLPAGDTPLGTLLQPMDVGVNAAGTYIYVADTGNNRVARIDAADGTQTNLGGTATGTANGAFNQPSGIAVDTAGNVYVADKLNNRVQKLTSALVFQSKWGVYSTTANGSFNNLQGIAALEEDAVYVADTKNNRIQYFEPNLPPTDITYNETHTLHIVEGVYSSNTLIGKLTTVDPNANDTSTYGFGTIQGQTCENSYFVFTGSGANAGQLNVKSGTTFDYETKNSYQVCVLSKDSTGLASHTIVVPLTVVIDDGSDAPIITANGTSSNSYTIDEYIDFDESHISTVNPNDDPNLNSKTKPGYILRGSSPTLTVTDNDTGDSVTKFEILTGSNSTFADAFEVVQVPGTNTADVKIKDSVDYKTLLNFEKNAQGTLTIQATDNDLPEHNTSTIILTVKLNNKGDWPIITTPGATFNVNENAASGTQVGDLITLTDQDSLGTKLNLTFETSTPYFQIIKNTPSGNTATFKIVTTSTPIDFETTPSFDLVVKATDGSTSPAAYAKAPVHITVNDLDEQPVLVQDYDIHTTAPVGSILDLITAASHDSNDPLTYTILDDNSNTGNTFSDSTGQITVANKTLLDYDYWQTQIPPYFQLKVSVKDASHDPVEGTVNIHVQQGNRAPVFVTNPAPTLSIPENTTDTNLEVGRISAMDADNDPLVFSTDTTDPNNPFIVTTASSAPWQGIVKLNPGRSNLLDYENATYYDLQVSVTDNQGTPVTPVTQTFRVSIVNVNEQIEITGLNPVGPSFTVGDRSAAGTVITTINWSDPDVGTQPSFVATGDGTEGFTVDSKGNVVRTSAPLHYYLKSSYSLVILVADNRVPGSIGDQTSRTVSITINLTDDNDPPTFNPTSFTVAEKSQDNSLVGTFDVFDENNDDFSVSVTGGTGQGAFNITTSDSKQVSQNGVLRLTRTVSIWITNGSLLDYETAAGHKLTLIFQGTDSKGKQSNPNIYNINLTDINEPPVFTNQTMSTYENALGSSIVGKLNAYDPDAGDSLTYNLSDGTGKGYFGINTNGEVYVITGKSSYLTIQNSPFTLIIQVTDKNTPQPHMVSATVTINITPKADPAIKAITVAPEIVIGSSMQFGVIISNEGLGTSSNFTLDFTLPASVSFVPTGSTSGCAMKSVDLLECAGVILNPKGTAGDTKSYTINAFLNSIVNDLSTVTIPIEVKTDINDLTGINNKQNLEFTARRDITITNQTFENRVVDDFYRQNVDGSQTPLTSADTIITTNPNNPDDVRTFLGTFGNDTIVFQKDNLLPHSKVTVTFDLNLGSPIDPWWGNNTSYGPNYWKLCHGTDCEKSTDYWLLDTTFSTYAENTGNAFMQNYPYSCTASDPHPCTGPGKEYAPNTGANELNVLGFTHIPTSRTDTVYKMKIGPFDSSDSTLILKFLGQNLGNQIWGIDNVKIYISGQGSFTLYIPFVRR